MHTGGERTPAKPENLRFPAPAIGLAASLLAAPLSAADYSWPVVRVVDGDTVKVDASADLPPELASLSVRLRGVDTPEKGRRAAPQPPSPRRRSPEPETSSSGTQPGANGAAASSRTSFWTAPRCRPS